MTKKELKDVLFSIDCARGYLKHNGQTQDYDRQHVLMHLNAAIEAVKADMPEPAVCEYSGLTNIAEYYKRHI